MNPKIMPKKTIYWGTLILLLFSTVATAAGIMDDDEDEQDTGSGAQTAVEENSGGAETAVTENSLKTYKHTMSVSVKNGKAVSPDNEIEVDTDSEIETGDNGKDFWRVEDAISFSFYLPNDASVRLKCALNNECTGEALIRWNGKTLRDKSDKKEFTFDGSNAFFEHPDLKTNRKENKLTFVCTDGEIGLESVTIYADIEYPSVKINEMVIQLTSPRPNVPLDGKPVSICWEEVTRGLADGGWVRISYRTPDMKEWQVVPGLEGITYGAKNWGNFTWENPPKAQSCEFQIEYTPGENPEDKRRAEESKKRQAISVAAKELIQAKKSFLDEVNGLVSSSFWKKYLNELRRDHQTLKAKLRKSMKDESNMNLKEVVQTIDALEQIYFTAFMQMMKVAPTIEDEKERNDIQTMVDEFDELLRQEFSNAREEYGEDEYAKVLIPRMFPKERFEAFKEAKEEFDRMVAAYAFAYQLKEKYKNPKVEVEIVERPHWLRDIHESINIVSMKSKEQLLRSWSIDPDNVLEFLKSGDYVVYITKDYKGIIKNVKDNNSLELNSGKPLKNHPEHVRIRKNTILFTTSGYLHAFTMDGKKLGEFSIDDDIRAISPDGFVILCGRKLQEIHTGMVLYELPKYDEFRWWNEDGLKISIIEDKDEDKDKDVWRYINYRFIIAP